MTQPIGTTVQQGVISTQLTTQTAQRPKVEAPAVEAAPPPPPPPPADTGRGASVDTTA